MIPFKYLGYDVKIEGPISPSTSQVRFTFSNGVDDNSYILKLNTEQDKLYTNVVKKIKNSGNNKVLVTERGVSFGYNTLVSDMRALPELKKTNCPVIFDATHSVQQPGGKGISSGGQREFVAPLARAAIAVGVDGIFMEVHDDPKNALSDGTTSVKLNNLSVLLQKNKYLWRKFK